MKIYQKSDSKIWTGRKSNNQLYFHEKIKCIDLEKDTLSNNQKKTIAILAYSCDEGVKRNKGRIGAIDGPNAIKKMLSPLSNHFEKEVSIYDVGAISCKNNDLESTQSKTSDKIHQLIENKYFTIILGGGHDLAYAHYNGLKKHYKNKTIGIINLDAHFDLRKILDQGNSGTPFYQIAKENDSFNYFCLGIQKESNNKDLFETANKLGVQYLENTVFNLRNLTKVLETLNNFISSVDHIYLTIDMDGFSSAYAPGVSAPSPLGFSPKIAFEAINLICQSNKLISADIVELNPKFDIDNCTARLAARLVYFLIEKVFNE